MICPYCKKPGKPIKCWYNSKGLLWIKYRCTTKACAFKYQPMFDVGEKTGYPTWAAPVKDKK